MTQHTPLPWKQVTTDEGFVIIVGESVMPPRFPYDSIAGIGDLEDTTGEDHANAEYIVTACNAYPKLVEALKAVERVYEYSLVCPWCYASEIDGHTNDCQRQDALAKGSG